MQELGVEALTGEADAPEGFVETNLPSALRDTLEVLPNETLRSALDAITPRGVLPPTTKLPQSWPDFLDRVRKRDWVAANLFLGAAERPELNAMGPADFEAVAEALEELLTDPLLQTDALGARVVANGLPVFVEEFVSEIEFPRMSLTQLYMQLLRLWVDVRCGSTFPPDGQVVLVLASAILQQPERNESEVAELIRKWWNARRVPALLPYVLEAVELLTEQVTDHEVAQGLWIDGADIIRRQTKNLSLGERNLWRHLGLKIGIDVSSVEECVGPAPISEAEELDPIAEAGLRKIAIVSLNQKAAQEARAMISERTNADVVVVSETSAGSATRSAATADAILFVWSANKHAVYRAFDGVRDRLVYVQGTGAASIVLALERWTATLQPAVD